MTFAKWVFRLSGIVGLLIIVPMFFTERQFNADYPPPVTHPEFYYGFLGVTLAWQILFLIISTDPVGLRKVIPAAMLEKLSYVIAAPVLYFAGRTPGMMAAGAILDALWLVLFTLAYLKLSPRRASTPR